ncbi:cysteine hydrolase family protein [Streptomyces sp. LaPpAH-108]|uniref:cysteine hydrolase family protein n=1 Tax=Streptomyces sp. LaPpAH-108 TaxID=1155714 RepID=UPI00036BB157|nr:cysteine hydrolase [Streptomyces sp. LaPpAH-108]
MPRTALLLMDLQVAHAAHMPDGYLPRAVRALHTARAAGVPVIHVALQLRADHVDAHPRNKIFGALPPGRYTAGDPGAALVPEAAPVDGEIVVHKNRVSAFAGNDLRQLLDTRGIEHVALAGVSTAGVVLAAAFQAADLDYGVTVLSDACADSDPALHDTVIGEVLIRRPDIGTATVEEWGRLLGVTG